MKRISLADYEKLYFDEEFNVALCKQVKLSRDLIKREEKDGKLERVVRVSPDREIPKPVAKVIGSNRIEYTEYVQYEYGKHLAKWYTKSSVLSDKVETHGEVRFAEVPGGVKRILNGEITVKIFGVGKIIEKFVAADIERGYEDAAKFTQQWIDKNS
ncbi:MAG: hypothetical protein A2289_10380 [Deltaproteobacteria bacterium RIFOXYA12_FULL_58_15]|nr:MAG: hypothetical protein A2289_10380 [Deltaproteobacteria bacterium RIFOXYA12_FULL_58_15]OGR13145.1 MAG: hypothetical protein A2341_08590 [Deltaproteobacteria bacterium RIFOXYB12_FULL_58_9]